MSIVQVNLVSGESYSFDLTPVITVQSIGIEAAWEKACLMLADMTSLLPRVQNQHNSIKADLYQEFKALPVNKDKANGDYNPGTDVFFNSTWLSSHPRYMESRAQRDALEGTVTSLRLTYIPRIKQLHEGVSTGERNVPSQMQQPNPMSTPTPSVAACPPPSNMAPAPNLSQATSR